MLDKEAAKALLDAALELNESIGKMDAIVSDISDPETKQKYVQSLGNVIGSVTFEIIVPIVKIYPELDPYKR